MGENRDYTEIIIHASQLFQENEALRIEKEKLTAEVIRLKRKVDQVKPFLCFNTKCESRDNKETCPICGHKNIPEL